MAAKPDVRDQRRGEIIDAATRVFSKKGFGGARMDDIVRESGLSKGLLYWYFASKDAIIKAVLDRMFAPELARLRELAMGRGSARERLHSLADLTANEIASIAKLIPITFEFIALAFRNRTVKKVLREFLEIFTDNIERVIAQGVESGEFHAVDARSVALSIAAYIDGCLLYWVFAPDLADYGAQIRSGIEVIVRGIERERSR